jgi:RNA polymerase sigma-70 factor (ECF subfamily)
MTPVTTPSSATPAPAENPVRAALSDPRTLEHLRAHAWVLLRRASPGAPQTRLAQLVEEVVSRTVETALTAKFDPARGTSVSAWLAGIARNIVKKETCTRPPLAAQASAIDWDKLLPDAAPTPAEQAEGRDEAERVRAVLGRLDPLDRQLLEMHYGDGLTAAEIGSRLDASPSTVRVWLHRARKAVAQFLTPSAEEGRS